MDICIRIIDSFCCMPKTNTTLYVNYSAIKFLKNYPSGNIRIENIILEIRSTINRISKRMDIVE